MSIDRKKANKELREASGDVSYSDPLTIFFYLLLRNSLPAGEVEELVRETIQSAEECSFTNGWLAEYANNLAERIRGATTESLKNALSKAFAPPEQKPEAAHQKTVSDTVTSVDSSFDVDDLHKLEERLIEAAKKAEEPEKASENIATEPATEAVDELLSKGLITEAEAEDLKEDIMSVVKITEKEPEEIPPKEGTEKITPEEAKKLVDSAVEEYSAVKHIIDADGYGPVSSEVETSNANEDIDTWLKERDIDTDGSIKWKNTQDELKKIEEEDESK